MAINLNGTFWCCKAVLPHMIKRGGGSIINVSSSTGAHDAKGNTVAYVTSKGGVALMTKAMAIDHAKENVRVNALCPGPTDTPMLRSVLSPQEMEAFAATFTMGRMGRPENVVKELLEGYTLGYADKVRLAGNNLVVRAIPKVMGKVGIVTLGGSGHEPGLSGFVGEGMLDVSVPGEIFAAPGAPRCLEAI